MQNKPPVNDAEQEPAAAPAAEVLDKTADTETGAETSAETPNEIASETPEGAKHKDFFESAKQTFEESVTEPDEILRQLESFKTIAGNNESELVGHLEAYFTQKQESGYFQKITARKAAEAVVAIDQRFPSLDPHIKSSFLTIALRHLDAGKLLSKIGSVEVKDEPGEEYQEQLYNKSKASAYYSFEDGLPKLYFYGKFKQEHPEAKKYHAFHEMSHILVESDSLWTRDIRTHFYELASNPARSGETAAFSQKHPELGEILKIIHSPQEQNLSVWSSYLQERLSALSPANTQIMTESQAIVEKRRVASEFLADLVAHYLADGDSAEAYLAQRFKVTRNETQDDHEGVLRLNGTWFNKLSGFFENNGEKIPEGIPEDMTDYDWLDLYDFDDDWQPDWYSEPEANAPAQPAPENLFSKVWNWLTGKKTAPQAPEQKQSNGPIQQAPR